MNSRSPDARCCKPVNLGFSLTLFKLPANRSRSPSHTSAIVSSCQGALTSSLPSSISTDASGLFFVNVSIMQVSPISDMRANSVLARPSRLTPGLLIPELNGPFPRKTPAFHPHRTPDPQPHGVSAPKPFRPTITSTAKIPNGFRALQTSEPQSSTGPLKSHVNAYTTHT